MQQLCQLSTLTSLTIQCDKVPRFVYDIAGQLTSLCLLHHHTASESHEKAAVAELLPLCKQLQQLHLGHGQHIVRALDNPAHLQQLAQLQLPEVHVGGTAAMELLSLSQFTSLQVRTLDLRAAAPASCGLRELKLGQASLQQLARMPLQQLTAPLGLSELSISSLNLQEQLQYAATAVRQLHAGPGCAVGGPDGSFWLHSEHPVHATPAALVQLLQACGPLLPIVSKTSVYRLRSFHLDAQVLWTFKCCLPASSQGVNQLSELHFSCCQLAADAWPALAIAFPCLSKLSFDVKPHLEDIWNYVLAANQHHTAPQCSIDIHGPGVNKDPGFKDRLRGRLAGSNISWITFE